MKIVGNRAAAWIIAGATSLIFCMPACAKIIETVIDLPVRVATISGEIVEQPIKLTIFHESARPRAPFLVINHGRAVSNDDRVKMGRARYSAIARYFVEMGFVVLVPTRVGYGVSGGPDVEYSGDCRRRNYPPAYEAAAQQTINAIEYARGLDYVDAGNGVVLGQSFGGTTAITIAAKNIPSVKAAVNFAGGGGGNPKTMPGQPCRDDLLTALFASYGGTAKIPTLWLYSENDRFFGVEKPRRWLEAFRAKGGQGEFVTLPPFEADGHRSFTGNQQVWRPAVELFLRNALGAAMPKAP